MKGIVQGSPMSTILANIALHRLHEALGKERLVIIDADDFHCYYQISGSHKTHNIGISKIHKAKGFNIETRENKNNKQRTRF